MTQRIPSLSSGSCGGTRKLQLVFRAEPLEGLVRDVVLGTAGTSGVDGTDQSLEAVPEAAEGAGEEGAAAVPMTLRRKGDERLAREEICRLSY